MPLAVMTPGRNDPCPCGSGRKYKLCCLRSAELVDLRAVRLRSDEGTVLPALLEFTASFYGPSVLEEARDRFFDSPDYDPEADLTDELFSQLFIPWFLFDFVADPNCRRRRGARIPPSTLAAAYLELFPQKLSESEREFIGAALATTVSYHLVTAVSPGRNIDLENLLTGDKRRVYEQSASKTVKPGVVLFARVVAIGDSAIMSGCAPLVLPPLWRPPARTVSLRVRPDSKPAASHARQYRWGTAGANHAAVCAPLLCPRGVRSTATAVVLEG